MECQGLNAEFVFSQRPSIEPTASRFVYALYMYIVVSEEGMQKLLISDRALK